MDLPPKTFADWRALVEKELAGKPFEAALVEQTPEGIPVAPLYTTLPATSFRDPAPEPFRICMRHAEADPEALLTDVEEGADALWLPLPATLRPELFPKLSNAFFVFDLEAGAPALESARRASKLEVRFALGWDALGTRAGSLAEVAEVARWVAEKAPGSSSVMVSTLPYHEAGANAVDELAAVFSTGARYLRMLMEAGLSADEAAGQVAIQISVGRDTFLELCKLRALRTGWRKVLAAVGAEQAPRTLVHAVCASRTLTVRDPWVNMLRVTTQVFAAVLGGADLVTPNAFDQALGVPSSQGRRVARNTGLVLREESLLGKVADPAGGSYAFEALTDSLARKAWERFRSLMKDGSIEDGSFAQGLEAGWQARRSAIARRKIPILGVSDFANLQEELPHPPATSLHGLRDSADFEALRARAEKSPLEAVLVTLGTLAESRPRAGFALSFFAAGGIPARESTRDEKAALVCLCGTDERYATEAIARVRALKAAGCGRVLVTGRPGALEGALREAGAEGFIFLGCDVVAMISELLPPLQGVA